MVVYKDLSKLNFGVTATIRSKSSLRDKVRVDPKTLEDIPQAFWHLPLKLLKWLRAYPGCCVLPLLLGHGGMQVMQLAIELGLGERRGTIERLRGWLNLLVGMEIITTRINPGDTRERLYSCLTLDDDAITWLESQWTRVPEQVRAKKMAAEKRFITLHHREQVLDKIRFPEGSSGGE